MRDLTDEPETAEIEKPIAPARRDGPPPQALVVEDDAAITRTCVQSLERLGMEVRVVWTRDEAIAVLSRKEPLAFVYADSRLFAAGWSDALAQVRSLRPATPAVVTTRSIGDILGGEGVALVKPFTPEQFQAAFDASLFDEETLQTMRDAAEAVRAIDAAEAAAAAAAPAPAPKDPAQFSMSA